MNNFSKRRRRKASTPSQLRKSMLASVTPGYIYEIVKLQVFLAKRGDPLAVREVLDRTMGRPAGAAEAAMIDRLQEHEAEEFRGIIEADILAMHETIPAFPEGETALITQTLEGPETHRDAS